MSKYSTLKAEIIASIKRNGAQAITGDLLQEKLLSMIDSLGEFYQFGGLAIPSTEFTPGDEPVVFIASTPGTYTNFGSLVVADSEVALLVWDGSAWSKQTTDIATRSEVSQLSQWFEKKTLTNDFQSGYTYYEDGHKDSNSAPATMLIQNNGYKAVKCTLGFDGDSYGAICFYSTSEQTTEGYIKSASIQSKAQASAEYFAYVPDNCVLIAVCNRPWTLGSPIVNIYQDVNKTIEELDLKIDNANNVSIFGSFNVNIGNGQVSAKGNVDVYFGNQFERFTDGTLLFTITKASGTNAVSFNPVSRKFEFNENGIIVGNTSGRYLLFNTNNVTIYYSNGRLDKPTLSLTKDFSDLTNSVIAEIMQQGYESWLRMVEWIGNDACSVIGHITDVHSGGNDKYKHFQYINTLNQLFGFDILVNNGDIGLDYSQSETDEQRNTLLMNVKNRMMTVCPWVFCRGNHERVVTMQKLGAIFNRASQNQFEKIVFGDDSFRSYGYVDFSVHKMRVYFLNTTDSDDVSIHYAMTETQIQWFADTLAELQENWNVVVLTHLCIDDCARTTTESGSYRYGNFDIFGRVMSGFNEKTNGWRGNVQWEFRNSVAGKIVCNLCGDSHFNNSAIYNDVRYIVRQGGGTMNPSVLPSGATYDAITDYATTAFYDVLVVKNNGNAKIFRIGVGGSERDLAFTY